MNKQEYVEKVEEVIQKQHSLYKTTYPWAQVTPPTKANKHRGGFIDNWWTLDDENGEVMNVGGTILDDPRFRHGSSSFMTSYVVALSYDEVKQSGEVETRNSVYTLGKKLVLSQ